MSREGVEGERTTSKSNSIANTIESISFLPLPLGGKGDPGCCIHQFARRKERLSSFLFSPCYKGKERTRNLGAAKITFDKMCIKMSREKERTKSRVKEREGKVDRFWQIGQKNPLSYRVCRLVCHVIVRILILRACSYVTIQ